jgi:hypothetical protein
MLAEVAAEVLSKDLLQVLALLVQEEAEQVEAPMAHLEHQTLEVVAVVDLIIVETLVETADQA